MAKLQARKCGRCEKIEETFSKTIFCSSCTHEIKKEQKIIEEKQHLVKLGYEVLNQPLFYKNGHRHYWLKTPCCNKETCMAYGNILKQLALYDIPPCTFCGGSTRISKAMAGYLEKYERKYDLAEYEEYSIKVRRKSERTYRLYKHILNPNDYKRGQGKNDWQLDHKASIIFCFKNGITVEQCSSLENLQLLPSYDNLAKGRKCIDGALSEQTIPEEIKALQRFNKFRIASDFENVYISGNEVVVRQYEIKNHADAVISRLRYLHNLIPNRIGARHLDIREVSVEIQKEFLNKWHIQGYISCKTALGLWRGDKLLAILTIGIPRYKQAEKCVELIRFCCHGEYVIVGAATKLWQHWRKLNPREKVVSYSLNRWGNGKLYEILGFKKHGTSTSPRLFWFSDQKIRSWRASALKMKNLDKPLAELTVKIHDPGITTWRFSPDNETWNDSRTKPKTSTID